MSDKDRNVVKVFGLFCRLKIILKKLLATHSVSKELNN
jgi:hypothetical protein